MDGMIGPAMPTGIIFLLCFMLITWLAYSGPGSSAASAQDAPKDNLIINYLPSSVTEDFLRQLFQPYGTIVHCKVVVDKNTGQSAGFGFVKYDNEGMASLDSSLALHEGVLVRWLPSFRRDGHRRHERLPVREQAHQGFTCCTTSPDAAATTAAIG